MVWHYLAQIPNPWASAQLIVGGCGYYLGSTQGFPTLSLIFSSASDIARSTHQNSICDVTHNLMYVVKDSRTYCKLLRF